MKKVYTAHEIYSQKIIYWVRSYKTTIWYIHLFRHILKPVTTGSKSGKRYYVTEENLKEFVRMFEHNELA